MTCEKCGGECYDNREKVAGGWRGPLFKCKDPACDWRKWAPKGSAPTKPARTAPTWGDLARTYERCLLLAEKYTAAMGKRLTMKPTAEAVLSAAATLFIAATRERVQDTPVAVPAKLDEPPAALVAAAEDDDLPF